MAIMDILIYFWTPIKMVASLSSVIYLEYKYIAQPLPYSDV